MLNITFGQGKYYIDNLVEIIHQEQRQKLSKGVWPSFAPFGYLNNYNTKGLNLDPDKAPLVLKAFFYLF